MKERLTIIGGDGEIPLLAVKTAIKKDYYIQFISLTQSQNNIKKITDNFVSISPGKVGCILKTIKNFKSDKILLAGNVSRGLLYRGLKPDITVLKAFRMLKGYDDKSIMDVIEKLIRKTGAKLISQREFLEEYLAKKGLIAGKKPPRKIISQVERFKPVIKNFEGMGAGQLCVIKNNNIVAIEAMEGSDETITRARRFVGGCFIVIKAVSDEHNFYFDMPAVGMQTLETMKKSNGNYLFIEAEKILILNPESFVQIAKDYKITVYGC
ncbi:MAG: UDP-2,3-diacylglucosamine diphosphatase LpxI domain-containing protein [bacterium]